MKGLKEVHLCDDCQEIWDKDGPRICPACGSPGTQLIEMVIIETGSKPLEKKDIP